MKQLPDDLAAMRGDRSLRAVPPPARATQCLNRAAQSGPEIELGTSGPPA
jgi:hypothetical protein